MSFTQKFYLWRLFSLQLTRKRYINCVSNPSTFSATCNAPPTPTSTHTSGPLPRSAAEEANRGAGPRIVRDPSAENSPPPLLSFLRPRIVRDPSRARSPPPPCVRARSPSPQSPIACCSGFPLGAWGALRAVSAFFSWFRVVGAWGQWDAGFPVLWYGPVDIKFLVFRSCGLTTSPLILVGFVSGAALIRSWRVGEKPRKNKRRNKSKQGTRQSLRADLAPVKNLSSFRPPQILTSSFSSEFRNYNSSVFYLLIQNAHSIILVEL